MAYKFFNPNPSKKLVGDCVIRAISAALNQTWDKTYVELAHEGLRANDMPTSNNVWGSYLKKA